MESAGNSYAFSPEWILTNKNGFEEDLPALNFFKTSCFYYLIFYDN